MFYYYYYLYLFFSITFSNTWVLNSGILIFLVALVSLSIHLFDYFVYSIDIVNMIDTWWFILLLGSVHIPWCYISNVGILCYCWYSLDQFNLNLFLITDSLIWKREKVMVWRYLNLNIQCFCLIKFELIKLYFWLKKCRLLY